MFHDKKFAFTLMEILVAMTVFGIVTLGLVLPFQESISLTTKNELISSANNLARLYFKEIELLWLNQSDFDAQRMPALTNQFTQNNMYTIKVSVKNMDQNTGNIWILKRVNVTYSDTTNSELVNFFMDYNRPGSTN
ncbi:MAG: type II secretion system protein [Candidatus Gastranaerophilaceae bacterium]|jgi:prepilin-type N-terminal cleavage/methylation domain-containing protein